MTTIHGMKFEILSKKHNPLMKRDDIEIIVEHPKSATPSRATLLEEISKLLNAEQNTVIIDKMFTQTGLQKTRVIVEVYKKAEDVPADKLRKSSQRMKREGKTKKEEKVGASEEKKEGE